jgi:Tfp pilus assembly protein PilP
VSALLLFLISISVPAQAATQLPSTLLKQRDPFKRPVISAATEGPRSELETIPVDSFKMLGVMTGGEHLKAMIQGPNGKTYFVQEKMPIGLRKGYIRKITDSAIYVREKIVNVLGQEETIESEILLPSDSKQDVRKVTSQKGW